MGCNFKIMVECNTSTEEIIAASYELWNAKFKSSEDITSAIRISNYEPYENLWTITSNDQPLIANADFNISVRLMK